MSAVRWNAQEYESVAAPQLAWGRRLLESRAWRGDEVVLDAGCGPGTLTLELLARVPRGRVVAVDHDPSMLDQAAKNLGPAGERARTVLQDLQNLALDERFDVVFSNAALHWVPDHDSVFSHFLRHLKPGGELLLQFGGEGNLERTRSLAREVAHSDAFASALADFKPPWHYEDDASTQERLLIAGFVNPKVSLEPAPTTFSDAAAVRQFAKAVVLGPYLQRLAESQREAFVDAFMQRLAQTDEPLTLDYVRLNVRAQRSPHH